MPRGDRSAQRAVPTGTRVAGVLGAGRQAVETSGYLRELGIAVEFFVEEDPATRVTAHGDLGAPVLDIAMALDHLAAVPVVAAVGSAGVRRRLVARWPGSTFLHVVSDRAWVAADAVVCDGATIAPMAAVNRFATIGRHVLVNVGALVSHDVALGDFSTVGPGCVLGGGVRVGEEAFLGIGAVIRDGITVGRGAVVAAGAVVVSDVADGATVMGVPARPASARSLV